MESQPVIGLRGVYTIHPSLDPLTHVEQVFKRFVHDLEASKTQPHAHQMLQQFMNHGCIVCIILADPSASQRVLHIQPEQLLDQDAPASASAAEPQA